MSAIEIPSQILLLINQLFEIEKKLVKIGPEQSISRNIERMKDIFAEMNIYYENPIGQPYSDTRTDCDAHIAGSNLDNLVITEVLKPLIRYKKEGFTRILQRSVVIVESKPLENSNG